MAEDRTDAISGGDGARPVDGGALGLEEEEDGGDSTRLANEAAGPPFSHILLLGVIFCVMAPTLSFLLPPSFGSEVAMRASNRRVFRVSKLK